MKWLRNLACLMVVALLAMLPACSGSSNPGSPGRKKVAFVTNNPENFWTIAEAGTRKAEKEFDVEVFFRRPPNGDAAEQKDIIDALIAQGVDAIAISVIDPKNQTSYLNRISEKIPVLTQDNDARDSKRVVYIGTNNYEAGREVGRLVKEAMPDGGVIAIFVGQMEPINARQRRQGVLDELADKPAPADIYEFTNNPDSGKYGKYRLQGTYTDNVDRKKAKDNTTDVLTQLQDEPNVCLVGLWAYNPPAMLLAVKDKEKLGKVKIVAFDEDFETLDGIRDGHIYATVVQNPFEFGYSSVKLMAALARGDKSGIPADGMAYVPHRVVNKDGDKGRHKVEPFRKELEELLQIKR